MMVDTAVYSDQGKRIWDVVRALVSETGIVHGVADGAASPAPGAEAERRSVETLRAQTDGDDSVRSITYAAFVGLIQPLGWFWVLYAQAVAVIAALYAVVAPVLRVLSPVAVAAVCAIVLAGSSLPTMATFLMPDIFGAVVVLFAIRLVMGLDALDLATRAVLVCITAASITFHYGNIPLAIGSFAIAALLRAGRKKAFAAVIAVAGGTAIAAIALNMAIGIVGFGTASIAPQRAAILLARSIEDGPARWVLEEDCSSATPDYALCEYWGTDIPTNVGAALWSDIGMEQAPPALNARIREQEFALLTEAFLTYPTQQAWALVENAVRQFFTVDARYARPGDLVPLDNGRQRVSPVEDTAFEHLRPALGEAHFWLYVAALTGLAFLRGFRGIAVVLFASLALNAAVFGGLSAPVPRYQSRVAWVAVAMATVFAAKALANRADALRREKAREAPRN
jgi:hypothetical protein